MRGRLTSAVQNVVLKFVPYRRSKSFYKDNNMLVIQYLVVGDKKYLIKENEL